MAKTLISWFNLIIALLRHHWSHLTCKWGTLQDNISDYIQSTYIWGTYKGRVPCDNVFIKLYMLIIITYQEKKRVVWRSFMSNALTSSIFANLWRFYLSTYTISPGLLLVWMFYSEGQATFLLENQTGIPRGMLEIVIKEVLWSIRGSYSSIRSLPLMNVKWHSDPWLTMTSQAIRLPTNFMTLIPRLTFTELWVASSKHLQRVWHVSRECFSFLTPGSVPLLGLACAPIVETTFLELAMSSFNFSP